ncbi:hypothetical protein AUK22_08110 [bacterium CG2_30_54_10]|nr:MAG: hypothetical protein AUK22_08110 [bacterium CG2_30_54_10]
METSLELSIVMPCLNEAETVGGCVRSAGDWLRSHQVDGEVIVADNGSTDGSQKIALAQGARIIAVSAKGYGNALSGGILGSRGRFIVMGDSDASYDFSALKPIVDKLREGYDLVQGCRFPSGGGIILPGAMPWSHRVVGNPFFSFLARWWFRVSIHDVYCGLRGFSREAFDRLQLRCTGMEFATEMILKAGLFGLRLAEVPITLHPDGRQGRAPHLCTWRDGWRTLRFFLLCSPMWLFVVPGILFLVLAALISILVFGQTRLFGVQIEVHSLAFGGAFLFCGIQSLFFGVFSRTFATEQGILPRDPHLDRFFRWFTLEKGIALGFLLGLLGFLISALALGVWWDAGFGDLDYSHTMKLVIPGSTLIGVGVQIILGSFTVSLLGLNRK